ncbi:hypothetical protein FA039_16490 [Escherichia coli]|nr:hypothetical protein [Escherichia coli]
MANPGGVKHCLTANRKEQNTIIATDRQLYQNGITSSVEGVETDINASKTRQQLNDVAGK